MLLSSNQFIQNFYVANYFDFINLSDDYWHKMKFSSYINDKLRTLVSFVLLVKNCINTLNTVFY